MIALINYNGCVYREHAMRSQIQHKETITPQSNYSHYDKLINVRYMYINLIKLHSLLDA